MGAPHEGGDIIFDKLKGCGGESLQRLFRLDFCIFESFIKSIFEESAIFHFLLILGPQRRPTVLMGLADPDWGPRGP